MTDYSKIGVHALARCWELFGHAWPCDGDTRTTDCPDDAQ